VTQQIVTALALTLSEGDRQRLLTEHTDNLEAYDLFLRGRELWWRQTKEANGKARELLQRASKSDPSFAPAFAFLGAAHVVDYINGWSTSPLISLEDAREAARRTVVLDERYPTAYWALAGVNLWSRQHDEAIREAERAISLNPNYADGHNFLG
jgi:adenylate cyclase